MAIEPLSSAMTYQAQTTQQVKALQKQPVENTDVQTPEQSLNYDPATVKVADVQQKDTQGNGQGTERNSSRRPTSRSKRPLSS